jgi:RNA-binding protein 26
MTRLRKLTAEMKAPSTSSTTDPVDDKEKKKKELLDMELDMHATSEKEETKESLQEKLSRLRAEASALGITDVSTPTYPSYRGARGRGRGRGGFRGVARGGRPQASMKLDNRPKALLVKGLATQDSHAIQSIRSWYEVCICYIADFRMQPITNTLLDRKFRVGSRNFGP